MAEWAVTPWQSALRNRPRPPAASARADAGLLHPLAGYPAPAVGDMERI